MIRELSSMMNDSVKILGGGLAGCEAAWFCANHGLKVHLYEMKPQVFSPAHTSENLAELVCSNSFRSVNPESPTGILKDEMRALGSLVMEAAEASRIPAGQALAVDRNLFSSYITEKIKAHPNIELHHEEISEISGDEITIIATGPMTSAALTNALHQLTGQNRLYFFDAISPIVEADTLDMNHCFKASRYGKGGDDYLNCPLTEEEYFQFVRGVVNGEKVEVKSFEKNLYFEACLPIEVLAERGEMTLAFGPMKPVGLIDPKTGKQAFAVVQLRMENKYRTLYNMVGFQTKLKYPEQERILKMIPALRNARFARLGSIHSNTYINSPQLLTKTLQLKKNPLIFFAGQITGVEGYVESSAMGIVSGFYAHTFIKDKHVKHMPQTTALGALLNYITDGNIKDFQPMNINFGLFPPQGGRFRDEKRLRVVKQAQDDFQKWLTTAPLN